jgi:hypothetical protein
MAAVAAASAAAAHDCHCRFSGSTYEQGETVCMRGKVARCGMYLNNSSWRVVADACPQADSTKLPLQVATSHVPEARRR